ncbi:MAG: adenylate/guanylate cyclase domain-containing protein [Nitrospirae bacterium]|nr:MAG: adenylate/guanylate cyclase domain-containing protein [Nitrospirota bacterium]
MGKLNLEWFKGEQVLRVLWGGGLTLAIILLYLTGTFEWVELRSYDLRYTLFEHLPKTPLTTPVLLLRIDEETEDRLNLRANDIPRAMYADAIRHLSEQGASLIAFDIIFSKPKDPVQDRAFAEAIQKAGNVVLARYIGEKGHRLPLPIFRDAELSEALINVELEKDRCLRGMPLLALDFSVEGPEPEPVLAMSLELARLYQLPQGEQELDLSNNDELGMGQLRIPYPDGRMRIHFYGPPATFPRMPFWKAVKGELDRDAVKGKIVLIGPSTPALHDYYCTPYLQKRTTTLKFDDKEQEEKVRGAMMDGFEIHANAIQTILDRRFVTRSKDQWGVMPMVLLMQGILGTALLIQSQRGSIVTTMFKWVLFIGIGGAGLFLLWRYDYWLDIMPMYSLLGAQYGAAVSYQRYFERQKRRQVQAMFGRYVSSRVVDQLVKNPDMANPSGRKERLTMFFSDIRGFTSMSEKMVPEEVQRLLSEYFTEMTRILFQHGGTLDKFMGDAVMAFFGNPEPQPDHALRAVLMALDMQEAIVQLNKKLEAEGRKTIGVGMGINTGDVTVGNLGSKDFLDYTVIGDAVNLACRLEQNAKAGEIIITQATYDEVKHAVEVEQMEPIKVKGKAEPIPIYRVLRRIPSSAVQTGHA